MRGIFFYGIKKCVFNNNNTIDLVAMESNKNRPGNVFLLDEKKKRKQMCACATAFVLLIIIVREA